MLKLFNSFHVVGDLFILLYVTRLIRATHYSVLIWRLHTMEYLRNISEIRNSETTLDAPEF